ncbi:hypothetical protein ACFL0W_03825 [Nanoarchaeota archaeon]
MKINKTMAILVLVLLLSSLFAGFAQAANPLSSLRTATGKLNLKGILDKAVNLFGGILEWYKPIDYKVTERDEFGTPIDEEPVYDDKFARNRKFVDFFLFFMIFTSLAFLAVNKWFDKGNARIALAVGIGASLSTALVALVKGGTALVIFFPFAKNILYLIVMLIFYYILTRKELLENSKVVAFILALAITWFAFSGVSFATGKGIDDVPGFGLLSDVASEYLDTPRDLMAKILGSREKGENFVKEYCESGDTPEERRKKITLLEKARLAYGDAESKIEIAEGKIAEILRENEKKVKEKNKQHK